VTLKKTSGGRAQTDGLISDRSLDGERWFLPLVLKRGDIESSYGGIGMHPDARPTKDHFDALTAPGFQDYLEFNTDHNEISYPRFARDVTATTPEYTWHFTFESDASARVATLQWNNAVLGNNPVHLLLYDAAAEVVVDMKAVSSYTFEPAGPQQA